MRKLYLTNPYVAVGAAAAKTDRGQRMLWSAVSFGAGLGAALVTRKAITAAWTGMTGSEPPQNPTDPDTTWTDAVTWAIAAGVGAGVARVVGRRLAAKGWEQATGSPPPVSRSTDEGSDA